MLYLTHSAPAGIDAAPSPTSAVRITTLVQAGLFAMVTGHLGRIPVLQVGSKDAPILLNDLFLLAALFASVLLVARSGRLRFDRVAVSALAFAVVGGASAVLAVPRFGLSAFELFFSLAYLVRWLAYFGLYVVVINFVRLGEVTGVARTLLWAGVGFGAFGILQSVFLPGFAQMVYPSSALYTDWDPQGNRLVSTFLDPNFAGALIVMVLLVSGGMLLYGARIPAPAMVVLGVAFALTLSRGAFLAGCVGALVLVAGRGVSRRVLKGGVAAMALGLVLLPWVVQYGIAFNKFEVEASGLGRILGWLRAIDLIARHPVIGIGFNTSGFVQQKIYDTELIRASFGLDGGLLLIGALTGVVGLSIFLAMLGMALARCRRLWRNSALPGSLRGLALGTAAATVAVVFHGFFLNTLLYPFLLQPLWILWGLTAVVAREARAGGRPLAASAAAAA